MIDAAYKRTVETVQKFKTECASLAELLLEKETINHDDIVGVLGERPFDTDAYQEYLRTTKKIEAERKAELESLNAELSPEKKINKNNDEDGMENLEPGLAASASTTADLGDSGVSQATAGSSDHTNKSDESNASTSG